MHRSVRATRSLGVAFCVLACLVLVSGAAAQGATSTWVHIQNLSTTDDATCRLDYFNQDGSVQHSDDLTIPAGGTVSRDTRTDYSDEEIPSGWRGSLVMYCSEPVAAVSDQYRGTVDSAPYASSGGYAGGALQVDLPIIMCNWYTWDTDFHVQNAGSEATTVSVEYVPSLSGVAHTTSIPDLQPGASESVEQSTLCDTIGSGDPKRFMGSVILTASQPIVAVVNEENSAELMQYAYDGFVAGATEIATPLIMARHATYSTSMQIQNRHATDDAEVQITYQADSEFTMPVEMQGSTVVANYTVGHGETLVRYEKYAGSWCWDGPNGDGNPSWGDLCDYDVFVGSAWVESTNGKPLVVIVNEESDPGFRALAYNGISYDEAGTDVAVPLIMYEHNGWLTGMHIQNLGSTQTSVTITYSPDPAYSVPSSGTVVKEFAIDPGDMLLRYEASWSPWSDLKEDFITFVGAARITSTTEDIAVIVNTDLPELTTDDWTSSYIGIYP